MSAAPLRLLVVEDEAPYRELLARQLSRRGNAVEAVGSAEEALALPGEFDVVLCDIALPGLSGIELIQKLRERAPATQCIVLTGQGSIPTAIEAMKLGAYHYFEKPVKFQELELYVQGAGEKRRALRENQDLRELSRRERVPDFVGVAPCVQEVRQLISRVAPSDAPVLIEGETGTGKDLVARAIHEASPRADRPFVAVNCGSLSETLLENELFGHVAGAFTGATKEQRGLFEVADGGTLFIDEVAEMSLDIQKKFLRVLENGEFRRLGESQTRVANVRVLAATNRVLRELVGQGRFREDLYYRLAVLSIRTPALREHPEDVPLLVEELLGRARARSGRGPVSVEPRALSALSRYPWPGNVRELRNVLERALVLCPGAELRLDELRGILEPPPPTPSSALPRPAPAPSPPPPSDGEDRSLEELERAHIQRVLQETDGNKTLAAKRLGLSLRTLYRRLEKLNLK